MIVFLKCTSNNGKRQLALRGGQRARVGSSEWVELSLPDSQLQPDHFAIDFQGTLRLVCSDNCQIEVGGQLLSELELQDGTEFGAGDCKFEIVTNGTSECMTVQELKRAENDTTPHEPWWSNVDWKAVDCPSQIIPQLKECNTVDLAVGRLIDLKNAAVAIRLIANMLSHPLCVSWTLSAVEASHEPIANSTRGGSLASLHAWLANPNEEQRLHIITVDEPQSAWEWLEQAVAWTGGSLAPAESEVVAPPVSLCGIASATAIQLHVASGESKQSLPELALVGLRCLEDSDASRS